MTNLNPNDLLQSVKQKLITASQTGDVDEIFRLASLAKELERIQIQEGHIVERLQQIQAEINQETTKMNTTAPHNYPIALSPQQRGDKARKQYLETLAKKGFPLQPIGKKKFKTKSGRIVGLPYAGELETKADRWFLGLASDKYDIVILLCETDSKETLDFVLPPTLVNKVWSVLTRSNGQVKFHVEKNGPNYKLRLPGGNFESINNCLSTTAVLS
jgi:hypothetical protein